MNKDWINDRAASFGMNVIIRYRFAVLLIVLLLAAAASMGLKHIELNSSNESFFPESDETIKLNNRFKEIFGNEEFIFILLEAENVFDHDALTFINDLTRDLEENLPFARDVVSLTNIEYIDAHDDVLYIDELIGENVPTDKSVLEDIKSKVLSKHVYVNRIITEDCKKTGIVITFNRFPDHVYLPVEKGFTTFKETGWADSLVVLKDQFYFQPGTDAKSGKTLEKVYDPRKLVPTALRAILNRHQHPEYRLTATGLPIMDLEAERVNASESSKFGSISLLVSLILLILLFRSAAAVIAPLIVIVASMIITFGTIGWLRIPLSVNAIMLPSLLVVLSVSYSIHVINHFQMAFRTNGDRDGALKYAFLHSVYPCFITALTTALGFASFLVVPIKPVREMGVVCAAGTVLAYLLVITVIPIFLSFGRNRKDADRAASALDDPEQVAGNPFLIKTADFVIRNALRISFVSLPVLFILVFFTFKVQVNSDILDIIGDRVPFVRDARHILSSLGGIYSYEVFIELPEEGMAKDPRVLAAMDSVAVYVESWGSKNQISSLNDIVKDLNMTMHNNDAAYFSIPDSPELIAQYLLLYEMSGGASVENWVDYDYQSLRLSVQTAETSTGIESKFAEIAGLGEKYFPAGTKVSFAGDIPILYRMMNMLAFGQIKSILAALVVITIVMMLILKSVKVGLISMIPNAIPILVISGLMGLLKFPLDIMTVIIAPMIIGIAVDDTVHYILHFKQEFLRTGSYTEANRRTWGKVGRAIIFTTVILTIGFGILSFSAVRSSCHAAILSAAGIAAALLADLLVTPVLFVFLKPFGKE